jgi:hypothetical protein
MSRLFLALYTEHPVATLGLRSPNGVEAEAADRAALTKVFELCFSGDEWTMDSALWEIVENRNFLAQVIRWQPKSAVSHKETGSGSKRGREKGRGSQSLPSESPPPLKRSKKGGGKGKDGGKPVRSYRR